MKRVKRGKRKAKKFSKARKKNKDKEKKQAERENSKPSSDDKPKLPDTFVFSKPKSQQIVSQLANNIASGQEVDPDFLSELRKSIPNQAAKIDVLMQAVASHQSRRLSKYLEAAGFTEQVLFHPEVITKLAPKDLLKLFELIQKHLVQITDFIEGKSTSPPVPELIKELLNLDQTKKTDVSKSKQDLEKLDTFSRERIRNTVSSLLSELRTIEEEQPVDAEVVEPERKKKTKSSKLGRVPKKKRRKKKQSSRRGEVPR